MASINTVALPFGYTAYNVVEVCSLPIQQAMLTAPAPGMQTVYVAIKQFLVLCLQTLFNCSVVGPPQRARVIFTASMKQEAIS